MTLTRQEIKTHQERLRREIVERECFLATLTIVDKHLASGNVAAAIDLDLMIPSIARPASIREVKDLTAAVPTPEPPALPPPPPVKRYVHPDLEALGDRHGNITQAVRWAVSQMTRDYSLPHLDALLRREGWGSSPAQVSVVLSRMRRTEEVEEIRPAQGPIPALFRRPDIERPADFKPLDEDLELPASVERQLQKANEDYAAWQEYKKNHPLPPRISEPALDTQAS